MKKGDKREEDARLRNARAVARRKRRVRASAEAIRVYDPVLADRLTLALDLSTEAA